MSVIRDGFLNELQRGKQQELMTDSCISQSRNVEAGRELERWVPDEDDPGCPELENIFDGSWNRYFACMNLFNSETSCLLHCG